MSSHPPRPTLGPHRHTCSEGAVSTGIPALARVTPANLAPSLERRSPAPELGTTVGSLGSLKEVNWQKLTPLLTESSQALTPGKAEPGV
ncbi:unnamed protein product, partial [Gulo gulo]